MLLMWCNDELLNEIHLATFILKQIILLFVFSEHYDLSFSP